MNKKEKKLKRMIWWRGLWRKLYPKTVKTKLTVGGYGISALVYHKFQGVVYVTFCNECKLDYSNLSDVAESFLDNYEALAKRRRRTINPW